MFIMRKSLKMGLPILYFKNNSNYSKKKLRKHVTGLWLGYNGPRYGCDQLNAKSPGKPWKMVGLEISGRRKKLGDIFCHFDSL